MKEPQQIILIDADIISHFIVAGEILFLPHIYKFPLYVLDQVYAELEKFRSKKAQVDNLVNMRLVMRMPFPEHLTEIRKEYFYIKKVMDKGDGEAACMAVARHSKHILASSNLKDVKRYCDLHQIQLLSTMDFLCEALKKGIFDLERCNLFIHTVRTKGGKLPVFNMEDYACP